MTTVRELHAGETELAYEVMLELRPDVGPRSEFVLYVDDVLRPEGYRLAAAFDGGDARAVAGFRIGHMLHRGRNMYVDDLVTLADHHGAGYGTSLMEWLQQEAVRAGCKSFHLDSGTHREQAHRFYFARGLTISSFHFWTPLSR